jgi:hypothetical protein
MEKMNAIEMTDEAIRALEAEGYEFTAKVFNRTSICNAQESRVKQVIELRCYKHLPAEEMPPEFKTLKCFSKDVPAGHEETRDG